MSNDNNGWQPIETAPTDGENILLLFGEVCTQGFFERGLFERGRWRPIRLPSHGCGCCADKDPEPEFWMPLPAPPNP